MQKTLFDKIWEAHEVNQLDDGSSVFYIDQHYIHEVTSPQAFSGLRQRGVEVFRPKQTIATADHNVPTQNQHLPIKDPASAAQLLTLSQNCSEFGVSLFDLEHKWNGIVHVIGPELGLTQPGMTVVCGDSHTSTHGAFGAIAFGIGTSEVEMVLASQALMLNKPKSMKIEVKGDLNPGVSAKDLALYLISELGTDGGTGYFVEYCGSAIRKLSMESRMTLCNMSIEMGARGGLIQADEITFDYLKDLEFTPKGEEFDNMLERWRELKTDEGALFDISYSFDADHILPMITWGTNPGMAIPLNSTIPDPVRSDGSPHKEFLSAMNYMDLAGGESMLGKPIDYVFLGSCTNGRIEDLREFAKYVKGHKKADTVTVWIVPGSRKVMEQAISEGIEDALQLAGFELREPGCSACLAMNEDKIPPGKYCVSTSNRNFEGRQGPGSRTFLASPKTAALAAINGWIAV
ncbi:MAG: 3-isopropylmalate dehydratase large subunit [Bacteroidales bacterium]|nr:3-isopropylmalate dehydratase large subunit [Bacteroidales bacterium]